MRSACAASTVTLRAVHRNVHKQLLVAPNLRHITPTNTMASGVEPTDLCITTYQELKLGRKHRYILYGLNDAQTEIVVNKTSDASNFEDFVKDLPRGECRWAVYDFEFEKEGEGKRSKLCFVSWSPDIARVKEKMVFAASREALRRRLDGITFEIQGTDPSEISYNTVLEKALTSSH